MAKKKGSGGKVKVVAARLNKEPYNIPSEMAEASKSRRVEERKHRKKKVEE